MFAITNILVATDFSECSDTALTYGRAMAERFGARLHVLHAVELMTPDVTGLSGYAAAIPQLQAELEASAKSQLEAAVTADDRKRFSALTVFCPGESPATAVIDYARKAQIDLVIIGTHGRKGLSHLVMGSVAEKVVRNAPCPVLIVREHERDFVVPGETLPKAVSL